MIGWLAFFSLGLLARAFSGGGAFSGWCGLWRLVVCWRAGDIGAGEFSACSGRGCFLRAWIVVWA